MNNRTWKIELGTGSPLILILTRKDSQPLNIIEWKKTLAKFYDKANFLIIDVAEKFLQENGDKNFTIKELAYFLYKYLLKNNIQPHIIWGFSMGGMICQELIGYREFQKTPLLLISTNLYATKKLQAIFSTWYLSLKYGTINDFYKVFYSWIISATNLPLFSIKKYNVNKIDNFGIKKLLYCIKAVSNHNACDTIKKASNKILILFGKNSTLLNQEEANIFIKYIPNAKIYFVENAGMRIMNNLDNKTINLINNYINEVTK